MTKRGTERLMLTQPDINVSFKDSYTVSIVTGWQYKEPGLISWTSTIAIVTFHYASVFTCNSKPFWLDFLFLFYLVQKSFFVLSNCENAVLIEETEKPQIQAS